MTRTICMALASLFLAWPANAAAAELIKKKSPYSVEETLDRLEKALKEKNIVVVVRVDHARNAESAGLKLPPTQLLVFGKPEHGTKLMEENRQIGIELPMKVLSWQDDTGQVWIAYNSPATIAKSYGIGADHEVVQQMSGGLDKLTDAATRR